MFPDYVSSSSSSSSGSSSSSSSGSSSFSSCCCCCGGGGGGGGGNRIVAILFPHCLTIIIISSNIFLNMIFKVMKNRVEKGTLQVRTNEFKHNLRAHM